MPQFEDIFSILTSGDLICLSSLIRKGHNFDSSDAAAVTTGPSSWTRSSVSLTLGPATLTVPATGPSSRDRIAAAKAVTPGSASLIASP
jgi:hypothetical protein